MHLAVICKKGKQNKSQRNQFCDTKLYCHNQKTFYNKLRYWKSVGISKRLKEKDVKKVCGDIFGNKVTYNENTTWLEDKRKEMENKSKAVLVDT